MRHINQAEAVQAIELLLAISDRRAGFGRVLDLDSKVENFLFDAAGDLRFDETDDDPSPDCPCNTCGPAGPFTCVRKD